jgi:hypothetical protein
MVIKELVMNRRFLLESLLKTSRLPSEFQEVEYLESSGTQYIDTGIVPEISNDVKPIIKIKCKINAISVQQRIFGVQTVNSQYFQFFNNINQLGIQLFNTSYYTSFTQDTNIHEYIFDTQNSLAYQDNNSQTLYFGNGESTYNLYLFARNNLGTASQLMKGKIFYFKYYNNNNLVRNFVPCYRKADNVAGLYDLVNGVFYTNAGTGTFIVGGNV